MKLPRLPRPLKIIAAIYAVYLALIMLVATPLLNLLAPKAYKTQTGRELRIENIIWLNPFALSVTARHVSSANVDGSRFWSADSLTANVSLASIWHRHLVLDAFELRGLYLQIEQTAADRYNFSDILEYRAKQIVADATPKKDNGEPLVIEIHRLLFSAAHLGYRAPYAGEPIAVTVADLNFALRDFSTAPEPTKNIETAKTTETIILPSLRGAGISLAFKTITIEFLRAQQPFSTRLQNLTLNIPALSTTAATQQSYELNVIDANNGNLQIKGNVDFSQRNVDGEVQLRHIDLLPAWQYLANKLAFAAQRAQLDGDIHYAASWGDKLAYKLDNSRIALRDVQLQANNDADTQLNFAALQVDNIQVDSTQPRAQIGKVLLDKLAVSGWNRDTQISLVDMFKFPSSDEPSDSPPWQIQVDDIALQNGEIHWRASQLEQLPLTLSPLALHAANLHWPDAAPLQLELKTTLNEQAQIALNGSIVPSEQSGELSGDLNNLPLSWGDTFVQQQMRATIVSGTLSSHFAVKLDKAKPALVQSDGAIEQFELQSLPDKRKLAAWKKLQWQQLALQTANQQVTVKRVTAAQPWVQFRINGDGTNNFQQLLKKSSSTAAAQKTSAPTHKSALTPALSQREREKNSAWQFAVDNIHIDSATLDFRDASLASAFRTNITDLSGDIDGLNNAGKKPARVGLKGTVDGYAPVALTGSVNAFAAKPALDITLDMTNLDLAALTPYSGTYAGYQIDGGRLTVQLAYTLQNDRIRGTNHIIVNQMQLGKQMSGPKVMDLPLRFAIYLLTDANGVMDLGVDVTGEVDDPNFSVGSIIWKAFRNVIVKTVTSPFRALANLAGAGGRDDLDRIEFTPGSDQITANQTEKLRTLNTALQKKVALKLGISGHVSPSQDLEALRDNQLSATLIKQGGINERDFQQQSKNWQREVAKLFKQRFPNEKANQLQVMQMNDAMRDNEELEPSALPQLAANRALAVKQLLVTDMGLAADRAFIKPVDLGSDQNPGLHTTMQVE